MWNRLAVWLTNYSLSKSDLSLEQRNEIITHILGSLRAVPINGIITVSDDGEVLLNGRSLDLEKLGQLKNSAIQALDNSAFKVINQEVLYAAVVGGLHKGKSDLDLLFYRAAIWFGQEFERQLKILAQKID